MKFSGQRMGTLEYISKCAPSGLPAPQILWTFFLMAPRFPFEDLALAHCCRSDGTGPRGPLTKERHKAMPGPPWTRSWSRRTGPGPCRFSSWPRCALLGLSAGNPSRGPEPPVRAIPRPGCLDQSVGQIFPTSSQPIPPMFQKPCVSAASGEHVGTKVRGRNPEPRKNPWGLWRVREEAGAWVSPGGLGQV